MRPHTRFRRFILFLAVLFFAGLACNAPVSEEGVPSPPASSATMTSVPAEAATEPAAATTEPVATAVPPERTPLPTFTRIQPTLAATVTPRASITPAATVTVRMTATPTEDASPGEPLSFTYNISWRLDPANSQMAIASVVIAARGGGGDYIFYHDDLPVAGPSFEYPWAACTANPGSLRVDSANGQSVKVDYFEQAPCPTPTPTRSS